MNSYLQTVYRDSLALLVDLYHLTMAYGYWKKGLTKKEATFNLFFRRKPFKGEFAIAAGLEIAMEYVRNFHFSEDDLAYLETLNFERKFLDYLAKLKITCSIDAMPEGTVVFPYEPLIRVQGPIIEAQILESPLLNIINFQSLIATKASRVRLAAESDSVVEFGMRRAQGIDGAISASRAAFIGGCDSTSHVLAGKLFHIPVRGTHAHSWIMAFDKEEEAFRTYAEVMPKNCIFLLDTYDTIEGAKKAVKVAKELGIKMAGVRLDSGDLVQLSHAVRKILDDAGFNEAKIMASNELDEWSIRDLKEKGAKIDVWGVGTHLVTAKDQPALDGVYKLSAVREDKGKWQGKTKISGDAAKTTHPGVLQVRRFFNEKGKAHADVLYDTEMQTPEMENLQYKDLLVPIMREGKDVYSYPSLQAIQKATKENLESFDPETRAFVNPKPYSVAK